MRAIHRYTTFYIKFDVEVCLVLQCFLLKIFTCNYVLCISLILLPLYLMLQISYSVQYIKYCLTPME